MSSTRNAGLLVLGVGLGAALGVLCAPRSGKVTRRFVRLKANSARVAVRDRGLQFKDSAIDRVENAKQGILEAKAHLAAAVEAGKQAYHDAKVG